MTTLRLIQTSVGERRFSVEAVVEGDNVPKTKATTEFTFAISSQDYEDIRWYLEEYLQRAADPAPIIAGRVERSMNQIGVSLFSALFQANEENRNLWIILKDCLDDIRVEIVTGVHEATLLPWELLRERENDAPLVLRARAFVRTLNATGSFGQPSRILVRPLRILLVICRPDRGDDVPFRSVAKYLIKSLGKNSGGAYQLDMLRPATFDRLRAVLNSAKSANKPYHVVHFDGHGIYQDVNAVLSGETPANPRGYVLFENPASPENLEFVDGEKIGQLLVAVDVPLLVLNSCRSAHAEPGSEPGAAGQARESANESYGSLAQEVIEAGVTGVVAMRYNVYVVTAAQFIGRLYAAIASGKPLGEAVSIGRKNLAEHSMREMGFVSRPLQDWFVPSVYETRPVAFLPSPEFNECTIMPRDSSDDREDLDLPPPPDAGVVGSDDVILALDRAYDDQRVALLHAYAGSGKTTAAVEFARWYTSTGGIDGTVLFTSFESYIPLPRVLDAIGQKFTNELAGSGVNWQTLTDAERTGVALDILNRCPVLWIWDNVETIAGASLAPGCRWTSEEKRELRDFLVAAKRTQAKILLTSRNDEKEWLGEIPARVVVGPLPRQEQYELARAIVEKEGQATFSALDWSSVLDFTSGNPLTIAIAVKLVLRDCVKDQKQLDVLAQKLWSNEANLSGELVSGYGRSLEVAIGGGLANAFSLAEQKQIAMLYIFRKYVTVYVYDALGYSHAPWCLEELRNIASEPLLNRAVEIGLLSRAAPYCYEMHPALPWILRKLFSQRFGPDVIDESNKESEVTRAYVGALARWAANFWRKLHSGDTTAFFNMFVDEKNYLNALQICQQNDNFAGNIMTFMQAFCLFYQKQSRWIEWARLLELTTPIFVNPADEGPRPGKEENWGLFNDYRVDLARREGQLVKAEQLQKRKVSWSRSQFESNRSSAPDARTLATDLARLAEIFRDMENPGCVSMFSEAISIYRELRDRHAEATATLNLGRAYHDVPAVRDFAEAKNMYEQGLALYGGDEHGRAMCLGNLGQLALEYWQTGAAAEKGKPLFAHTAAEDYYVKALLLFPRFALRDRAIVHNALGGILVSRGAFSDAIKQFTEAITIFDNQKDTLASAGMRLNIALVLHENGRPIDAREYALSALALFKRVGLAAAELAKRAQELVRQLESEINN